MLVLGDTVDIHYTTKAASLSDGSVVISGCISIISSPPSPRPPVLRSPLCIAVFIALSARYKSARRTGCTYYASVNYCQFLAVPLEIDNLGIYRTDLPAKFSGYDLFQD